MKRRFALCLVVLTASGCSKGGGVLKEDDSLEVKDFKKLFAEVQRRGAESHVQFLKAEGQQLWMRRKYVYSNFTYTIGKIDSKFTTYGAEIHCTEQEIYDTGTDMSKFPPEIQPQAPAGGVVRTFPIVASY